ncbi:MAG TPA: glycine hydroxymethyltransferase, partial [Chlamydiales bacterium]|nr:glycine hydroxymethyltransferase [Chlamydiales bacterium]
IVLGGPLPHVMAAKALAFQEIKNPSFKEYAHQIVKNAQALASKLMELGVKVLTGGTDNHLIQVDVQTSFGINGRQAENLLRKALITVNRNAIPFDQNGPWYTSGIRLGTPALTTLGMKEVQMSEIATVIHNVLSNASKKVLDNGKISKAEAEIDSQILSDNTQKIHYLLKNFCLYPQLILD